MERYDEVPERDDEAGAAFARELSSQRPQPTDLYRLMLRSRLAGARASGAGVPTGPERRRAAALAMVSAAAGTLLLLLGVLALGGSGPLG